MRKSISQELLASGTAYAPQHGGIGLMVPQSSGGLGRWSSPLRATMSRQGTALSRLGDSSAGSPGEPVVPRENKASRGRSVSAEGRGRGWEGTRVGSAEPGHRASRAGRASRARCFTRPWAGGGTESGARADADVEGRKARNSAGAELGPRAAVPSLGPLYHAAPWWPAVAEAAAPWEEAADSRTRAAKAPAREDLLRWGVSLLGGRGGRRGVASLAASGSAGAAQHAEEGEDGEPAREH